MFDRAWPSVMKVDSKLIKRDKTHNSFKHWKNSTWKDKSTHKATPHKVFFDKNTKTNS